MVLSNETKISVLLGKELTTKVNCKIYFEIFHISLFKCRSGSLHEPCATERLDP